MKRCAAKPQTITGKREKAIPSEVHDYGDDNDMFNTNANGSDIENGNGNGNAFCIVRFHKEGQICWSVRLSNQCTHTSYAIRLLGIVSYWR